MNAANCDVSQGSGFCILRQRMKESVIGGGAVPGVLLWISTRSVCREGMVLFEAHSSPRKEEEQSDF